MAKNEDDQQKTNSKQKTTRKTKVRATKTLAKLKTYQQKLWLI